MTLTLTRTRYEPTGIFGELTREGVHIAFTLEHSYDNQPAVAPDTYTCKRGQHELLGMSQNFITFEVEAVPGHTGILFHTGNVNNDSHGCILVGQAVKGNVLLESRKAFATFMALLAGETTFTLTVVNA